MTYLWKNFWLFCLINKRLLQMMTPQELIMIFKTPHLSGNNKEILIEEQDLLGMNLDLCHRLLYQVCHHLSLQIPWRQVNWFLKNDNDPSFQKCTVKCWVHHHAAWPPYQGVLSILWHIPLEVILHQKVEHPWGMDLLSRIKFLRNSLFFKC